MISRDRLLAIATNCGDLTTDARGRKDWSFDEYGLRRFADALQLAAATDFFDFPARPRNCRRHMQQVMPHLTLAQECQQCGLGPCAYYPEAAP